MSFAMPSISLDTKFSSLEHNTHRSSSRLIHSSRLSLYDEGPDQEILLEKLFAPHLCFHFGCDCKAMKIRCSVVSCTNISHFKFPGQKSIVLKNNMNILEY